LLIVGAKRKSRLDQIEGGDGCGLMLQRNRKEMAPEKGQKKKG